MEERLYEEYARIQDHHWWFYGRRAIVTAAVERWLDEPQGGSRRILDVGCGPGTNLALLRNFGSVDGVDTDPAAVAFCKRRGEQAVRLAEGTRLPFPDESFDLLTMLDVLEHIEDENAALKEAARVLAPGGSLLVTVPAYMWMWGVQDDIAHHRRRYTARRLRRALRRSGLQPVHSSYFNTLLFGPIAAIRVARRLRGSRPGHSDFEVGRHAHVDRVLGAVMAAEAIPCTRIGLPFGVSILAHARLARA